MNKLSLSKLLSFFIAVILISSVYISCRKTDELSAAHHNINTIKEKFFHLYRSADAKEKQLVEYLKKQNDQLGFLEKTVNQIGYPHWNKAIAVRQKKRAAITRDQSNDSTTLYYIPFVRDSQYYVNAAMIIDASLSDTSFQYYCDWQYRRLSNDSSDISIDNAEKFALFFMILDKEVFGTKRFNIIDTTLFNFGNAMAKRVQLDTVPPTSTSNLNQYELYCQNVAITVYEPCELRNVGRFPYMCEATQWAMICWFELVLGGFPGGGGGGTGGGGGGTPPDCGDPQGRIAARGDLPCIEEPGWEPEPIEEEPTFDPLVADTVILDTAITNNFPCVKKIIDSINKYYVVVNGLNQYLNVNAVAQLALQQVFNVNKKIHATISVDWTFTKDSLDGRTTSAQPVPTNGLDFYTKIKLNPWVLRNATQEYIAAVILHEAFHSYIDYKTFEYSHGTIDSTQFKSLFPLYWPLRNSGGYLTGGGATTQHNVMAASLVTMLSAPLYTVNSNPNISYALKDSLYKALAWGGLQKTIVWRNKADTFSVISFNTIARDTSIRAPFILIGGNGTQYLHDATNLHMKKGCQ